jgi:serine/threonine protein kinase
MNYMMYVIHSLIARFTLAHSLLSSSSLFYRLSHPNIVNCLGYFQDYEELHMVLEYASLGSIAEYGMYKKHTKFTNQDKKRLVHHVTSALAHLQVNRIAHRDVKTENVLVCMDTSKQQPEPMAKLADFGYAIYCGAATSDKNSDDAAVWRSTLCGTLACLPPEMLEEEEGGFCSPSYDALRVDAWSLGVLAYELVMDEPLFTSSNNSRESLKQGIWQFKPRDPDIWSRGSRKTAPSAGLIDFCAKLLERDPDTRVLPAQALEHAWLVPSTSMPTTDAATSSSNSSNKRKRVAVVSPHPVEPTTKKGIQRRRRRRRQL